MFRWILAGDNRKNQLVRDRLCRLWLLLDRLVKGSLGFLGAAEMELSDCLGDQAADGRRGLGLCKLLEDVECLLVFLTTLDVSSQLGAFGKTSEIPFPGEKGQRTSRRPTQDSARLTSRLSCAHLRAADHLLHREVVAVLLKVNLNNQCNGLH